MKVQNILIFLRRWFSSQERIMMFDNETLFFSYKNHTNIEKLQFFKESMFCFYF